MRRPLSVHTSGPFVVELCGFWVSQQESGVPAAFWGVPSGGAGQTEHARQRTGHQSFAFITHQPF